MQILLVEDDVKVAEFVAGGLRQVGHLVTLCNNGRDGLLQAVNERFDVIILDRMLPFVDGLKVLLTLRATNDSTPVLLLSALADVDERVKGLQSGADDYLVKPFSITELVARVEALARRNTTVLEQTTEILIGELTIDLLKVEVRKNGQLLDLTPREFRILRTLAEHDGRVVTRSMLLEKVWDYSFDPQTNIIDQHISKLRQKIDSPNSESFIRTVRGSGYILRVP